MPPDKPIRILRIIARLNIGGPAIQAISLSEQFSDKDYRTLLLCGKVGTNEADMLYLAKEKGVEPLFIPELGREISFLDDLKSYLSIRRVIKRFKPDIIHTHTAKAGTLGRFAAIIQNLFLKKQRKIRLVHTFHGHVFHSYFGPLKSKIFIQIERLLAKFTDRIIVISPKQEIDICGKYNIANREKVRVIPLGFDLKIFSSQDKSCLKIREKYLHNGKDVVKLVGIIGRLTKVKNHRIFLDSITCLKDKRSIDLFKFLIVGDGELKEDLQRYSRDLGLSDYVIFAGWQRDMPSIYGALDIVVLTSLNEGTPVTLIEAMAAEKPVLATDVGGVSDLMGKTIGDKDKKYRLAENGILISSGDSEALAEALIYIAEDGEEVKDMTDRARDFVLQNYSMERLIGDIDSLYSELLIKS